MLPFKKTLLFSTTFLILSVMNVPIYSQSNSADSILKQADLMKLIGTNQAVNLAAQTADPKDSSKDVNDFNDFVAIGVLSVPSAHTNLTNFDAKQTIIKKVTQNSPWIGVAQYTQNQIPNVTLQDGLLAVQACMSKRGTPTPSQDVANVVIYKTLNTSQFVYDYSFKVPNQEYCQEILYTPSTKSCETGMQSVCHIDVSRMTRSNKTT